MAAKTSVRPSIKRKGMWDVFVGGFHRVTKKTKKGAEGYAKRIEKANMGKRRTGPSMQVKSNKGRKVSAGTRIVMKLGALRRLIGAARKGKKTTIKARRAR